MFPGLTNPAEAAYVTVAAQSLRTGLMRLMLTGIMSATVSSVEQGLNRLWLVGPAPSGGASKATHGLSRSRAAGSIRMRLR